MTRFYSFSLEGHPELCLMLFRSKIMILLVPACTWSHCPPCSRQKRVRRNSDFLFFGNVLSLTIKLSTKVRARAKGSASRCFPQTIFALALTKHPWEFAVERYSFGSLASSQHPPAQSKVSTPSEHDLATCPLSPAARVRTSTRMPW